VFGHKVEATTGECIRSLGGYHRKLVQDARVDRQKHGFNVEESFVLCPRCIRVVPLKV
jgi:hypothetical protein